jgi:GH15 family glucan-1,4-alpha-glucosidase
MDELDKLLKDRYDIASLDEIQSFLKSKRTLTFTPLSTGLFSAAHTTEYSKGTNYHAAWVRDNVHIAYAHLVTGEPGVAVAIVRALSKFFSRPTQKERFDNIIKDPSLKNDAGQKNRFKSMLADPTQKDKVGETMPRPHVRFDGDKLEEILTEWWDHAQNDALGYFVWLYAEIVLFPLRQSSRSEVLIKPKEWETHLETLGLFLRYFEAIEYWKDKDSGHWEETRKVSASSIGAVVAGLIKIQEWHNRAEEITRKNERWFFSPYPYYYVQARTYLPKDLLSDLIAKGLKALLGILPDECSLGNAEELRKYDSALLFLVYPLGIVTGPLADLIVDRTEKNLRASMGIKRYPGDSFYCTDYERLTAERNDKETRNYSQDMASRDAIFTPGGEAQWCIFDSIISIHYGRRYKLSRSEEDLRKQTEYLNRSLRQITTEDDLPRCKAFQCPELYYREGSKLQTSKSTPLLWTQANLRTALETMRASLTSDTGASPAQPTND